MWTATISYLSYRPAWYWAWGGEILCSVAHCRRSSDKPRANGIIQLPYDDKDSRWWVLTHTIQKLPGLGGGHVSWQLFSRWPDGISIFGKSAVLQKAWCHCYYHRLQWQILYVARGLIIKRSHTFGLEHVRPSWMNVTATGDWIVFIWSFCHHHHHHNNKHRLCAATRPT